MTTRSHKYVSGLDKEGPGGTFALFAHEERSRWGYMHGQSRAQFGGDIPWYVGDDDPEDDMLGRVRRPVLTEWTVDDEWDAVPDGWPEEEAPAWWVPDMSVASPAECRLVAHGGVVYPPRGHDEIIVCLLTSAWQLGYEARAEVRSPGSAQTAIADLLIVGHGRRWVVEVKTGLGSQVQQAAHQLLRLRQMLGEEWEPVFVCPVVNRSKSTTPPITPEAFYETLNVNARQRHRAAS